MRAQSEKCHCMRNFLVSDNMMSKDQGNVPKIKDSSYSHSSGIR